MKTSKAFTSKTIIFNLIIFFCIFAIIAILELSLRIFGYGFDTNLFIRETTKFGDVYIDNPKWFWKYYPSENNLSPNFVSNVFPVNKSARTLRGFVVGESTAEGFPYRPNHSFSKILEHSLSKNSKYDKTEIINLGMSAMSSYTVEDVSKKILNYNPDFLIIYSGHNEVYGTISATTGGNHFTKEIYMFLKEFRVFQLLYNTLNHDIKPTDETLMHKQFGNHLVNFDDETNQKINEDYIKNIDSVVKTYSSKNIPVIIMGPASNLIDMAPFAGKGDEEVRTTFPDIIKTFTSQHLIKDPSALQTISNSKYNDNANIAYLQAALETSQTGKVNLQSFSNAKDLDLIPFRMRTSTLNALEKYISSQSSTKNLYYIPTQKKLVDWYGTSAMSNDFFIDHLHYNFKGNVAVAKMLSEVLCSVFDFSDFDKIAVETYYSDSLKIKQDILLLPIQEMIYYNKITSLIAQPPYSTMIFPYVQTPMYDFLPPVPIKEEPNFHTEAYWKIQFGMTPKALDFLVNHYITQKDFDTLLKYFTMFIQVYPRDPSSYVNLAYFYDSLQPDPKLAFENYLRAYVYSNYKKTMFDKLSEFLTRIGKTNYIDQVKSDFGAPKD